MGTQVVRNLISYDRSSLSLRSTGGPEKAGATRGVKQPQNKVQPSARSEIEERLMESITAKCAIAIASFLTLCSFQACQTHPSRIIHQTEELTITLRAMPTGYPALDPYRHPHTIQVKDASDILASLRYEIGSLLPFSRGERRQVFTKDQVNLLGSAISEALGQASPQDVLAFSIADVEKSDRKTKGLVFILGDELHLIIESIRTPSYQGEQKPYQQQVPKWELLPGDNQRHYASRPEGKGVITNWVITPLRLEATQHE